MVSAAREGVRVGDMTLCATCNRAIVMYRLWGGEDSWFHMRVIRYPELHHAGVPRKG